MTLLTRQEALQEKPEKCMHCNGEDIAYWDETDEEIVFQFQNCRAFIPIPFDTDKLRFYFAL